MRPEHRVSARPPQRCNIDYPTQSEPGWRFGWKDGTDEACEIFRAHAGNNMVVKPVQIIAADIPSSGIFVDLTALELRKLGAN